MYRLIDSSYTLADIGRFTELSIRRGIPLASVVKTEPRDRRVVVGAALLFVPTVAFSEETLLQRYEGFLQGAGSWLKAEPAELLASALEEGLLEAAEDPQDGAPARWRSRLEPLPGVTANRLADELEAAQAMLKLRRARMREPLRSPPTPQPEIPTRLGGAELCISALSCGWRWKKHKRPGWPEKFLLAPSWLRTAR